MNYASQANQVTRGLVRGIRRDLEAVRCAVGQEPLHRMRVACRRFHNAVTVFEELLPPDVCALDKDIRKVLKRLGPARDLDVQFIYFQKIDRTSRGRVSSKALEEYLKYLRQLRKGLQPEMTTAVARLERKLLRKKIQIALTSGKAGHPRQKFFVRILRGRLRRLIRDVVRYEKFVSHPGRIKELHRMRIAAKHLRYTLESLASLFPRRLDAEIRDILNLHRLLGNLHDYHVWQTQLADFAARHKHPPYFAPFVQKLQKAYQKTHRRTVRAWCLSRQRGLWVNLENFADNLR